MKNISIFTSLALFSISLLATDAHVLPHTVLKSGKNYEIRNGGYGSAAFADPNHTNRFYALTDRGPNGKYKGKGAKGKVFPVSGYTPRIGYFEIQNNKIVKIKDILLKTPSGKHISGLPNSKKLGGTGETPYALNQKPIMKNGKIAYDDFGLDGEGLVVLGDGSFWISDEYGPHIVHFDKTGREIERINPFREDARASKYLPKEFANRRPNRGMEGLAITPNEKTLVGIMQSTMYNPNKKVKKLNLTRIVTINLENGKIAQYIYAQEKNQNANSEITALDNNTFLVIERDGSYPLKDKNSQKHIYKITLNSGTNLENVALNSHLQQDDELGLLIDGQTLEQNVLNNGWDILAKHQIKPVQKELVVDLVKSIHYPHEKLEGIVLFSNKTLGVINDDDFAITSTKKGKIQQKYLDNEKTMQDASTLYIIKNLNLSTK